MSRSLTVTAAAYMAIAACGVSLPPLSYSPNADDAMRFAELEQRWEAAGLEPVATERYHDLRPYLRVVVVGDAGFEALCSRCAPGSCPGYRGSEACPHGCGSECYVSPCVGSWPHCWGSGNEFLGGHETPLIVVHEARAPDGFPSPSLVQHGYLHFLGDVSGRGVDGNHADDAIWALDR